MNPQSRSLIAGIGNIFFGDDAFGCEVAQRMARRALPEGVQVVDFGIRGLDLAYALTEDRELTILVDAMPRGEPPGTLYVIKPEPNQPAQPSPPDGHSLDPESVLRHAKSLGGDLERIVLVGCEPTPLDEDADIQEGLSPPVEAAVERAIELIESLVARQLSGEAAVSEPVDVATLFYGGEPLAAVTKEDSTKEDSK